MPAFNITMKVIHPIPGMANCPQSRWYTCKYDDKFDYEKTFAEMKREIVQQFYTRPIPQSTPTILWHQRMIKYVDEHFLLSYPYAIHRDPFAKYACGLQGPIKNDELIREHLNNYKKAGVLIPDGHGTGYWLNLTIFLLPHKDILTIKPPPPCPQINALVASHSDPNSYLSTLPPELVCQISEYMGGNTEDALERMRDFNKFKSFKE